MNLVSLTRLVCGGPGSGRRPGSNSVKNLVKYKKISGREFYHLTDKDSLSGILKKGLLVRNPEYHIGQAPVGAYIADPKGDALGNLHKSKSIEELENRTSDGSRLIKIKLPHNWELHPDPMMSERSGSFYSKKPIPAKFIKEWKPKGEK